VMVAQAYNPSNSGGRDQEDCGLRPVWANSLQDPISKNHQKKKDWWNSSRCRSCVQTPVLQRKKKATEYGR
jgi:hypothetical protein